MADFNQDQDSPYISVDLDAGYPKGTLIGVASGVYTKATASMDHEQLVGVVQATTTAAGKATLKLLNAAGTVQFLAGGAIASLDVSLTAFSDGEVVADGAGEIVGRPLHTAADGALVTAIPMLVEAGS